MEPIVIALISGSGTALVGLIWKAVRTARFGKSEDEALATKNAKVAVEAVSDVLGDLRTERIEQRKHIVILEKTLREANARITTLEFELGQLRKNVERKA
jgi:hypothetical protein